MPHVLYGPLLRRRTAANRIDTRWALLALEFVLLSAELAPLVAVLPTRISTQIASQAKHSFGALVLGCAVPSCLRTVPQWRPRALPLREYSVGSSLAPSRPCPPALPPTCTPCLHP